MANWNVFLVHIFRPGAPSFRVLCEMVGKLSVWREAPGPRSLLRHETYSHFLAAQRALEPLGFLPMRQSLFFPDVLVKAREQLKPWMKIPSFNQPDVGS
jgi:hypothetical protein